MHIEIKKFVAVLNSRPAGKEALLEELVSKNWCQE